jgi:hypothetical protein
MNTGLAPEPSALRRFAARVVLTRPENDAAALSRDAAQGAPRLRPVNRRTHRRLTPDDVQWLRTARLKYGAQVRIIDISAGGMLIEAEDPPPAGSRIVFELTGPERTMLVACRVLRCDPLTDDSRPRFRVGCAFVRPLDLPELAGDARLDDAAGDIVAVESPGALRDADPQPPSGRTAALGTAWQKVIVRYRDGQLLRGYTNNFHTDRAQLHLSHEPCSGETVMVPLSRVKALFFVREFAGNPRHVERPDFQGRAPGRKLEITFHDGEVLVGSTISFRQDGNGFFVHPADPSSNNLRVFVVLGAIQHLRFL